MIRAVRMELQDLKQTVTSWDDGRDDLVEVDLDAVRGNPEAAATLPPATLARALAAAADRIAALEREIVSHEHEESALHERLARLADDHSYTRGRMETLHEVIGALHGNLEDLRQQRDRQRALDAPPPQRVLRPADGGAPGMRDQHGSYP